MKHKTERYLPIWYFATKPFWWLLANGISATIYLIEKMELLLELTKDIRVFPNMQTKAQKAIKKHQRQAKRTQKQTWKDVERLSEIVNSSKPGDDFYRQAINAITCLRRLKRKTQENMVIWKLADEIIQRLLQVGRTK